MKKMEVTRRFVICKNRNCDSMPYTVETTGRVIEIKHCSFCSSTDIDVDIEKPAPAVRRSRIFKPKSK